MVKKKIIFPTITECEAYWEELHTPQHIREHMRQVGRVVRYLGEALQEAGESVNVDLVERAALLHDALRVTEWDRLDFTYFPYTPEKKDIAVWKAQRAKYPSTLSHAQVNHDLFVEKYPEMAQLILLHSIIDAPHVTTWEEKLLNYSDRRVAHNRIVTLQERLDEAYERYRKTAKTPLERDPEIIRVMQIIEKEIFSIIGGDPDLLPL